MPYSWESLLIAGDITSIETEDGIYIACETNSKGSLLPRAKKDEVILTIREFDRSGRGKVDYPTFLAIATTKITNRDDNK